MIGDYLYNKKMNKDIIKIYNNHIWKGFLKDKKTGQEITMDYTGFDCLRYKYKKKILTYLQDKKQKEQQ